ncbi:MAG: helix-turn-helix domain-containing protein [Paludibacteraceae bacterium]|nr:helix-turn-helix domain-containing protein [Paludibacteraceae bacterium]
MTLYTDSIFLTNDVEGFRECREKRTVSSTATMTVLYCKQGFIDVYYRGGMLRISKGDLFIRIPDFSHELGPYEMSPDFEFLQVTVDAELFNQIMFEHMRVEPNWYLKQEYVKQNPIFPLNAKSLEFFEGYFHMLALQLADKPSAYRTQIMTLISRAATMEMLNYMDKLAVLNGVIEARTVVTQSDYTFHAFTRLLQTHPHEREVQWYAKQLKITPKYLSEICKEVSGKSAGEWIAEITVSELTHYLRNTTLSIYDIAKAMEFPNASFFCQYTKKHTGLTPNQFRKQKKS